MNEQLLSQCRAIESIGTGIEQVAQLILVVVSLKPAAELSLYEWNMSPMDVEKRLSEAGLKYLRREHSKHYNTVAEYAISKDEKMAEKLLKASTDREFGTLFGYPETAIHAFEQSSSYEGELPADYDRSLFRFRFSKDHFEQEYETIRKWNQAFLEYAPSLVQKWHDIRVN